MKLLFASDLHGSARYIEALCRRVEAEAPERLVLLGDLLYHGPRNALPAEYDTVRSAELLNALAPPPLCIRGNCDGEVDQMMLAFPILADFAVLFADGHSVYLTHGHHLEQAASACAAGDIVFSGHTHVPAFSCRDGVYYVNPGSVSIPKEDSPHSYLLWDSGLLQWKDVVTGEVWREERL